MRHAQVTTPYLNEANAGQYVNVDLQVAGKRLDQLTRVLE
jgi:hypothetical protein